MVVLFKRLQVTAVAVLIGNGAPRLLAVYNIMQVFTLMLPLQVTGQLVHVVLPVYWASQGRLYMLRPMWCHPSSIGSSCGSAASL